MCFDCNQGFHGAVLLALGWACWKTYLGRMESDWYYGAGMGVLGAALAFQPGQEADAVSVLESGSTAKVTFAGGEVRQPLRDTAMRMPLVRSGLRNQSR